ncbi:ASIC5 [Branchiostoma lanceolatum]|uniref:ASIC5 protein n=1 Tax=Branchiostoma lanceolatum TaxID=7740 RepID=A0A8J9YU60_BRALA|nr:ASIC5 [Branchiostoma lanceolatum]
MLTSDEKSPEREFIDNTSLHGFNRIHHPNRAIRAVWIVAMLGAYAGFIYMAVEMARTYFSYDTVCDVKLSFENKMTFPAVTICNYNRIDSHKLTWAEWSILSTLLYGSAMDVPTLQAFLGPTFSAVNRTTNGTVTNATTMDMAAAVRMKGFDISPTRMYLCEFGGGSCTELNYTHTFSAYGNCYTFNADAANPLNQTIPGATMGFQVVINVMADSYTETIAASGHTDVGLKFLIHDQNEPPMVETHGLSIKPGVHSFVSVKRTEYYNHVPPWGECQNLNLEYFDAYTLPGCNVECRGKHVEERCGCTAYYLPGSAPPCDPDVLFTCVKDVLAEVNEGKLTCDCPLPCSMVKYSPSLSFSAWPNQLTEDYYSTTYNLSRGYLTDNFVVLSVYYEDFSYMKISQLKAMDGGQLGCNMGGMMGLFIGASVLTLVELTEYLVARLSKSWDKKKRPQAVQVQPAVALDTSEKKIKQQPDYFVIHK